MGGQFLCSYDENKRILTIEENPLFFPSFFHLDDASEEKKIKNVSAIVGENGSGKSSILNYLKEISGSFHGIKESILVFRRAEGRIAVYRHKNHSMDINNLTESVVVDVPIDGLGRVDFKDTDVIYYSNVFDHQEQEHYYVHALKNISTNYLIKQDGRNSSFSRKSDVEIHKTKEMERQIQFVFSNDARYIKKEFKLPDELAIQVQDVDVTLMYKEMQRFHVTEFFKKIVGELSLDRPPHNFDNTDNYGRYNFMHSLVLRVVKQLFLEMPKYNLIEILEKESKKYNAIRNENLMEKVVIWLIRIRYALKKSKHGEGYEFVNALIKILFFFDAKIWSGKLNFSREHRGITVNTKENLEVFQELLGNNLKTIGNTSILEFSWRDLSSGEKALLNLYARFYSLVNTEGKKRYSSLEKNIIVLIDEGELYLHPQWQKRFLLNLLKFLPDMLGRHGVEAIQIILTSNSPFIVSDLPSSHVIFLKRQGDETLVISGLDDHRQTFSSNIHNLLSHSFFMQNGTIGEFAKNKINKTIDLLINGNVKDIKKNQDRIEYLISIIGEPIIRNQMLGLLEDRLAIMSLDLGERVQGLEEEISKLRDLEEEISKLRSRIDP